jgi:hypothetical protein
MLYGDLRMSTYSARALSVVPTCSRNAFSPGRSCSNLPSASARKVSMRALSSSALALGSSLAARWRTSGSASPPAA